MNNQNNHLNGIMFDIETLGTLPGSAILSIGAVRFDIGKKFISDEFYVNLDITSSLSAGFTYEKATINWWKEQNPEALAALKTNALPCTEGLQQFFDYVKKGPKGEKIWAWGAQFDPVLTEVAFVKALDLRTPWHYSNVMCCRTVSKTFNVPIDRSGGTHHNALDDAKSQALYLINLFSEE